MLPVALIDDVANALRRHSELLGKTLLNLVRTIADFKDLVGSQFRLVVSLATIVRSITHLVLHIIHSGSRFQMVWIDAVAVATLVSNDKTFWDVAVMMNIRHTMSRRILAM